MYYQNSKRYRTPIRIIPSDFIAIDFETANSERCSPCSIGIAIVKGGEVVDSFEQLIKPHKAHSEFDDFNIDIHGITPEMVADALEFDTVISKLAPLFVDNVVVAHNMSFDASVLFQTCKVYGYKVPKCKTICSMCISRLAYPRLRSHKLNVVCKHLGVDLEHHHAASDAIASAKIVLDSGKNHSEVIAKSGYCFGYINNDGHWTPFVSKKC